MHTRTTLARVATTVLVAAVMIPVLASAQTAERSPTQGLKETDKFVKAGGSTTEAITEGKVQLQKTLDAYNALVSQPSTDMKGDYKRLLKASDSMSSKVASGAGITDPG